MTWSSGIRYGQPSTPGRAHRFSGQSQHYTTRWRDITNPPPVHEHDPCHHMPVLKMLSRAIDTPACHNHCTLTSQHTSKLDACYCFQRRTHTKHESPVRDGNPIHLPHLDSESRHCAPRNPLRPPAQHTYAAFRSHPRIIMLGPRMIRSDQRETTL